MSNYKEIIRHIKMKLPNFQIDSDIEDLPTIVFDNLADYLIKSINEENKTIVNIVIDVLNESVESTDPLVKSGLDDFFLTIYDKQREMSFEFINSLSSHGILRFKENIDAWNRQYE